MRRNKQTGGTLNRGNSRDNIERYALSDPEQTYGYQPSDWEVVDYRLRRFPGTQVFFRRCPFKTSTGRPRPLVAMLGGAQTMSRFCSIPLPEIITETTVWNARNFGHGGATPAFFLKLGDAFLRRVNACDVAVVQVMSARAAANAHVSTPDPLAPNLVLRRGAENARFINQVWDDLVQSLGQAELMDMVAQSRAEYVAGMQALLARITVPKILLWYSERRPDYVIDPSNWRRVLGTFPHLVTGEMMDLLIPYCNAYVEAIGSAERPHRLVNRFTGEPVPFYTERREPDVNFYYPTPAMHQAAAQALVPVLSRFAAGHDRPPLQSRHAPQKAGGEAHAAA